MDNADYNRGLEALEYFFQASKQLYSGFELSWTEFINFINSQNKSYIAGLGLGIELAEIPDYKIQEAMWALAETTQAGVPVPVSTFTDAIMERATSFDIYDAEEVLGKTLNDLGDLSQEVGKSTIEAVKETSGAVSFYSKYSKIILPLVAIAVGYYFLKRAEFAVKGGLGSIGKKVKKKIRSLV